VPNRDSGWLRSVLGGGTHDLSGYRQEPELKIAARCFERMVTRDAPADENLDRMPGKSFTLSPNLDDRVDIPTLFGV